MRSYTPKSINCSGSEAEGYISSYKGESGVGEKKEIKLTCIADHRMCGQKPISELNAWIKFAVHISWMREKERKGKEKKFKTGKKWSKGGESEGVAQASRTSRTSVPCQAYQPSSSLSLKKVCPIHQKQPIKRGQSIDFLSRNSLSSSTQLFTMSFLFGGQPKMSSEQKIAQAETEVEMISDMFNR